MAEEKKTTCTACGYEGSEGPGEGTCPDCGGEMTTKEATGSEEAGGETA